ncbi:MAG TPA: NAD(P)-dependent oxidoreductase [Bacteroidota bacterium]
MSAKKVLLIGSNGLLGQKIADLLLRGTAYDLTLASLASESSRKLPSTSYLQLDICVKKDVKKVIQAVEPEIIVNAAAMTNVDACETRREDAWKINVEGVENIIDGARKSGAKIFHVSTDYLFDGKEGPYDENSRPEPINYYGKTKLASENALRASGLDYFVARTIVLYGYATGAKLNFATWLIQSLEKNSAVRIVDDQFSNPTLADDLAYGIMRGIEMKRSGFYNIAGRDIVNRFEFSLKLARVFGFDPSLISAIKTKQLKQPAARPLKSGLVTLKAEVELGIKPSTVDQGLMVLKNQISNHSKRMADSAPVPGPSGRHKS